MTQLFWGIERVDIAFLVEKNHRTKDAVLQTLAVCTCCLQRVTEIFDSAGLILTESEADSAAKALEDHLTTYAWLAARDYQRRVLRFKIRTKAHYLWHVSQEIRELKLNQNLHHTFQEESFLGKIKAVATKCHGRTCTQRIFQRLFLCLAVVLHEYDKKEASLE